MSIKFPRHIWGHLPECPRCRCVLGWEDGDGGSGIQPPYAGHFHCGECGETWGESGPRDAEYAAASWPEGDDFFTN